MEEKDLFKKIKNESENNVPDVYDKILFDAHAQGLFNDGKNQEVYSDGETVALGGVNRKAVAITTLAALAAVSLAIALPIALSGKYEGGNFFSDLKLGNDYAIGAVTTAKLVESFLEGESGEAGEEAFLSNRTADKLSLVVNPDKVGVERYIDEFENYFYACNSFFGEQPVSVEYEKNSDSKYNNSVAVTGQFSNGDEARYVMHYTEARIVGDTSVAGNEVRYYLEGEVYLNGKSYDMVGERVYENSTEEKVKSLSLKAYSDERNKDNRIELSVIYGADGLAIEYDFSVFRDDYVVSKSILTFPKDDAYSVVILGEDGASDGKFTVNNPLSGWDSFIIGYEIGNLKSQFSVSATKSTFERVLAPDGLIYTDLGDGTCIISGYDKNKVLPEELILPAEYDGKKVVEIGGSAFNQCTSICRLVVPEGVTTIKSFAFYQCNNLAEIVLPESLTEIQVCALGYTAIKEINLPENLVTVSRQVFISCSKLEKVSLPETLETLDAQAFQECENLKSVIIPAGIKTIGRGVFAGTSLENITVDPANPNYYVDGGCLLDKATKTVMGGIVGFTVPEDATAIGEYAFYYCEHNTDVILSESVKEIGDLAFDRSNFNSIVMPGVEKIGSSALANGAWQSLNFKSLVEFGYKPFEGCKNLKSVNFPASLRAISDSPFRSCDALESITVDEGNPVYHSASNCIIQTADRQLIVGCNTSVIPDDDSVSSIGKFAFEGCQIQSITIPDSVTSIENYAFTGCHFLTEVVLSTHLNDIGSDAFSYCENLTRIELPEGLVYIGAYAFGYCNNLKEVILPSTLEHCIQGAFVGCTSLKSLVLPSKLTLIDKETCKDCFALESVTIPESVTAIGFQAFYGCYRLTLIEFDGTIEEWNKIEKGDGWDWDTGDYTVICTDGTLSKDGTVINN